MNLTEALDAALPELPARSALRTFPKLHPKMKWREHIEEGVPVIVTHIPGNSDIFRFTREQWELAQLFDGRRSYQEVAQAYQDQTNAAYEESDVRQFAATLRDNGLWQPTAGEQAEAYQHKHLKSRKKSRWSDVAHIDFSAWDPDSFFTRIHPYLKFLYSGWFTVLTLCLFSFMTYVLVGHWNEIGQDTFKYYSFTGKGLSDLAEFWILFFFLGFFHESAHGLTCKHYGGGVHRMGFMLLYLEPCFFVDVSESLVYATRWQRLAIIIAGIWTELIFCALATIVWWGSGTGSYVHELAYKIILITGFAVVVFNLNPLIKIDGYYFLCDLIGVPEIKERSTSFVSGWVKRHIFGLPVEYEYLNPRNAWLFVLYALASGVYSYLLLYLFSQFAYNVLRRYSPEWAFLPALYIAYILFRSRLRNLGKFMKTLYLDKKERFLAWLTVPRCAALIGAIGVFLFGPFWRESIEGRFALEPEQGAVIHAEVPGQVREIFVDEGSPVAIGTPLVRLQNLALETRAAQAQAQAEVASAHATEAQLKYSNFGPADREKEELTEQARVFTEQIAKLTITSPITGIVTTPRVHDLMDSSLKAGAPVVEVADLSQMRARIYVPEAALRYVGIGANAAVKLDGYLAPLSGRVDSLAPASTEIEPGLTHEENYKGIRAPNYYVATVVVPNGQRKLLDGMSGTARIYCARSSLVSLAWRNVRELLGRKFW